MSVSEVCSWLVKLSLLTPQLVRQVTSLFKKLGFRTFAVQVEKAEFVSRKLSARGSYSLGLVDRTAMFDAEVLSSVKSI